MTKEEPVMKILEHNRILIVPETRYAGGVYRTHTDEIEVKEWESTYMLNISETKIEEQTEIKNKTKQTK